MVASRAPVANDFLARTVLFSRGRVDDLVLPIEVCGVVAFAAVDRVCLAVTGAEDVIACAAVKRVGLGVVTATDVAAGERPQPVVAVVTPRLVNAESGEDDVVTGTAVLQVIPVPAMQHVVTVITVLDVVPTASEQQIVADTTAHGVVSASCVHAVVTASGVDGVGIVRAAQVLCCVVPVDGRGHCYSC